MSHSGYSCPEQTHESPTHALETEQQERDDKRDRRHGSLVRDQVAWIPGEESHSEVKVDVAAWHAVTGHFDVRQDDTSVVERETLASPLR
jgi:hypothetical protein